MSKFQKSIGIISMVAQLVILVTQALQKPGTMTADPPPSP